MPRLWAPGDTLMLVPVNLAEIWSKPRAVMPFSGQETKKADTGGWWEVCSVRNASFSDCGSWWTLCVGVGKSDDWVRG